MGTTTTRPSTEPAQYQPQENFEEFCQRHRGDRGCATSSARRATSPKGEAEAAAHNPWYSVPTFRRLAALLARLLPAWARGPARRNPGLTAWLILFTGVGLTIVAPGSRPPHPDHNPKRYQAWLQMRGEDAVRACVAEIGLNQTVVPTVRASRQSEWIAGTYSSWQATIAFNSRHEFGDAGLLAVAAHESVHALFDQLALRPEGGPREDFNLLVEETTAEILGAHIAGDALSRMGRDGTAFTAWLIDEHRRDCDPNRRGSVANHYFRARELDHDAFGDMPFRAALVHFGPPELVEAVVQICERERLPVTAAKAVSRRFIRDRISDRDQPISEEFERRMQAHWS